MKKPKEKIPEPDLKFTVIEEAVPRTILTIVILGVISGIGYMLYSAIIRNNVPAQAGLVALTIFLFHTAYSYYVPRYKNRRTEMEKILYEKTINQNEE